MPGEIEFLDEGDGPDRPEEEQPEHGPLRGWPRWGIAVGTLVVAGAITAAITLHGGGGQPQAAATRSPTATPSQRVSVVAPPAPTLPAPTLRVTNPAFAAAVSDFLPGQPDIGSIAVVHDHVVVLAPGNLARISHDKNGNLHPDGESHVGLPIGDPTYADWELISDSHNLWAVGGGRVYRIDGSTLRPGPLIHSPGGFAGAGALDGHLYLNTDVGVYEVAPDATAVSKPVVTRGGRAIAVDPTRHRLLLLDHDNDWSIRAYSPAKHKTMAGRKLPFDARSLTVAGGAIWLTGTKTDADFKPVLARLDPTTLRVISHGELASTLSAAPTLVAGQTDLWVRSGHQLWCVNARSGAVAQHWPSLPGDVAARDGRAFVADGNVIGQLRLNGACAG